MKERLNHWTLFEDEVETVRALNRLLKGWAGYFRFGNYHHVLGKMQYYLRGKLVRWLWRRHRPTLTWAEANTLADRLNLYRMANAAEPIEIR